MKPRIPDAISEDYSALVAENERLGELDDIAMRYGFAQDGDLEVRRTRVMWLYRLPDRNVTREETRRILARRPK